MWQDKKVRAEFETRARARLEEILPLLVGQEGVVAIELDSGEYFVSETLGKANATAYAQFPDTWVYFARIGDPDAAMALPTW
jgi:hypothetical protein